MLNFYAAKCIRRPPKTGKRSPPRSATKVIAWQKRLSSEVFKSAPSWPTRRRLEATPSGSYLPTRLARIPVCLGLKSLEPVLLRCFSAFWRKLGPAIAMVAIDHKSVKKGVSGPYLASNGYKLPPAKGWGGKNSMRHRQGCQKGIPT